MRKPPPFSAQRHNFSNPSRITINPLYPPPPYSAKYQPDLLVHLCAMKALIPSLEDLINSVNSSPWTNSSIVADSHVTLTLPKYTSRNTPRLLSTKHKTDPLLLPEVQRLWTLHKTNSRNPSPTTKDLELQPSQHPRRNKRRKKDVYTADERGEREYT
ncbi:hypothetical protein SLA2020_474460 [Shorea laevis]